MKSSPITSRAHDTTHIGASFGAFRMSNLIASLCAGGDGAWLRPLRCHFLKAGDRIEDDKT